MDGNLSSRDFDLLQTEFQVPLGVGESRHGNDLECIGPCAKLEEIDNFIV
jgi:hypothetical protein